MEFVLQNWRSDRAEDHLGESTMLRFRDLVTEERIDSDLEFGRNLEALIEAAANGNVYLDLEGVEFLCASDIGKVVLAWKKLNDADRRLVLCNVEPFVGEPLHITRVDTLMEIHGGGAFSIVDVSESRGHRSIVEVSREQFSSLENYQQAGPGPPSPSPSSRSGSRNASSSVGLGDQGCGDRKPCARQCISSK
jgi:anti-anti-sigma factor